MVTTAAYIAFIVAIAVPGGWGIVGAVLWLIRKTVDSKDAPFSFQPMDFWLGTTERAIAMAIMLWTPENLAVFVGGWTAAKIAANWGRMKSDGTYVRTGHLIALIGSAISFALAISGAVLIKRMHG
jgi:hypothetical protein